MCSWYFVKLGFKVMVLFRNFLFLIKFFLVGIKFIEFNKVYFRCIFRYIKGEVIFCCMIFFSMFRFFFMLVVFILSKWYFVFRYCWYCFMERLGWFISWFLRLKCFKCFCSWFVISRLILFCIVKILFRFWLKFFD